MSEAALAKIQKDVREIILLFVCAICFTGDSLTFFSAPNSRRSLRFTRTLSPSPSPAKRECSRLLVKDDLDVCCLQDYCLRELAAGAAVGGEGRPAQLVALERRWRRRLRGELVPRPSRSCFTCMHTPTSFEPQQCGPLFGSRRLFEFVRFNCSDDVILINLIVCVEHHILLWSLLLHFKRGIIVAESVQINLLDIYRELYAINHEQDINTHAHALKSEEALSLLCARTDDESEFIAGAPSC